MRPKQGVVFAIAFFLFLPVVSKGAEFDSSNGYRFEYPDNWKMATQSDRAALKEKAVNTLGKAANPAILDVMVYNPGTSPVQNFNVVVMPGEAPIDEGNLPRADYVSQDESHSFTGHRRNFNTQLTRIGAYDAFSSTWVQQYGSQDMEQWQVEFSNGGRTYFFTCTAGPQDFASIKPTFEQIINSIRFSEADVAPTRRFAAQFGLAAKVALIGLVVVIILVAMGLMFVLGRKSANATSPITGQPWNNE